MATPSAPKIPKVEEDGDELAVKSFKLTSEDRVPLVSNMHVSNVPLEATETHVRDVFSVCGPLLRVVVNRPEGFAPKTTSAFVMYKFREGNISLFCSASCSQDFLQMPNSPFPTWPASK